MKRALLLILILWSSPVLLAVPALQQGTVVRMKMVDCYRPGRGFMAAMSGAARAPTGDLCPQYILVTDQVVYVILGKKSSALVPLADVTKFRLQNNEMLIRIDDANHESHFNIMEMMLRPAWERAQLLEEQQASEPQRYHPSDEAIVNTR